MAFKFIKTAKNLIAVLNGDATVVTADHPKFEQITAAAEANDAAAVAALTAPPPAPPTVEDVPEYSGGRLELKDGQVLHNGVALHSTLVDRILLCAEQNLPFDPLLKFLERLLKNPSGRAVREAYEWLRHHDIKITDDGCWLGYKRLNYAPGNDETTFAAGGGEPTGRPIFVDVHSGTVRQWVGKVVEVERNTVDDDWGRDCSQGLHVGAASYQFGGQVKVVVKVDPADMVTVPRGETNKCRVSRYEVVEVLPDDAAILDGGPVYTGESPVRPVDPLPPKPVEPAPAVEEEDERTYKVRVQVKGKYSTAMLEAIAEELDEQGSSYHDEIEDGESDEEHFVTYSDVSKDDADAFKADIELLDPPYLGTIEITSEDDEADDQDGVDEDPEEDGEDEEEEDQDGDDDTEPSTVVEVAFFGRPSDKDRARVDGLVTPLISPGNGDTIDGVDPQGNATLRVLFHGGVSDHHLDDLVDDLTAFRFVRSARRV